MDSVHDLGGREGFGPIDPEPDEPVFHADWERRAWGLTMATFGAGLNNGGQFRHAIERMDGVHYLRSPYYEHWITALATRAVEGALIRHDELEQRCGGAFPLSHPERGATPPPAGSATFAVGDRVRVRDVQTRGHTRCPSYVRRRTGTVVRVDPSSSLPDVEAHSDERVIEPVYSVRFEAAELWGAGDAAVHVDLWQSYLEPD